ncbi:hypothetical protein BJV78DRAFT_284161 [Lactifluus subvellereus]|nr:hypothetical protein BJV78DRAFT_284161 [Lactifluus subvellereus]
MGHRRIIYSKPWNTVHTIPLGKEVNRYDSQLRSLTQNESVWAPGFARGTRGALNEGDIGKRFEALLPKCSLMDSTATHIQIGLNVAIPACSLCINRQLYKIATHQGGMVPGPCTR